MADEKSFKNFFWWVLNILLCFTFLVSGSMKILGIPAMVEEFNLIGAGQWFRYFTGALELLGAVSLLIHFTRQFAALLLSAIMIGAIATNLSILHRPTVVTVTLFILSMISFFFPSTKKITLQQVWAGLLGAGFIVVGVFRYFPIESIPDLKTPEPVHGFLHLLTGVMFFGSAFALQGKFAISMNRWLGLFWTLLGLAGLLNVFQMDEVLAFHDNYTHLAVGLICLFIGWK